MEKKSYVPKTTKYSPSEDGSGQKTLNSPILCKWCNKELSESQKYNFLRGKAGQTCSKTCGNLLFHHGTKEAMDKKYTKKCIVCGCDFISKIKRQKVCSNNCSFILSSRRMKSKNPMFLQEYREKASESQKRLGHKPIKQGGNGRGATVHQLIFYNEISKYNSFFEMEVIEKTGIYRIEHKVPPHFKIDIGNRNLKIAIEIDGSSHNTLKVKECDKRKNTVLSLLGWKVLRFTNSQIEKELQSCVQTVLSMI